jgi:hypothetical protein
MTTSDKQEQQKIKQLYKDYHNFLLKLEQLRKEAYKVHALYAKKIQEFKLNKVRKKL